MFSQALVGIAQIDTAGRFNLVNNRFCEIVGRPASQLLQTRIEDIAVPEDAPYLRDLLREAKADPPPPRYDVDDVVRAGKRRRHRPSAVRRSHSGR